MRSARLVFLFLLFGTVCSQGAIAVEAKKLNAEQIKVFRSWIVTIVEDQVSRGANPRWNHRDCAGLLRFAVREALAEHNQNWRKANGFVGRPLPAELELTNSEREALKLWKIEGGKSTDFARALPLIQQNADFIGKTIERIEPGDLLFFDQGDDQHLMVWTGRRIVYHTGQRAPSKKIVKDLGLRAVTFKELMKISDSRWQPHADNPNFAGFYRLSFLTPSISD